MSFQWQLRLPDEARSLPPPPLVNFNTVWTALMGWTSILLSNAIQRRPVLSAAVHKQLFAASVGFYIGNYLNKRAAYYQAKRDRDMENYMQRHPEDFKEKEKKTLAEVLEEFYPVR